MNCDRLLSCIGGNREDIALFTERLIKFKTENPIPEDYRTVGSIGEGEHECQRYLKELLEDTGCTVDLWQTISGHQNVVGVLEGTGEGGKSLILNGHTDTVIVGRVENWSSNPWGEIKEGKVIGRGAADMKGGVACMIKAVEAIRSLHIKLRGDVIIELSAEEEIVGPGGTRECIKRGYMADAALFTEPTNLHIVPVEPGMIHLRIEVRGRGGHQSNRYLNLQAGGHGESINAIEKAVKIIQAIRDLELHWTNVKRYRLLPEGLNYLAPGIIMGGPGGGKDGILHAINNPGSIPDYCSIEYEMKWYPGEELDSLKREFEDYIRKVSAADPWLKDHPPTVTWNIRGIYYPPASTPPDNPFIQLLTDCQRSVCGEYQVKGFTAVSDLAWYAEKNVPSALYGPGKIAQAHAVDEYVDIGDLVNATKTIGLLIVKWCA